MSASPSNDLTGSRFINLCVANWFLQIYIASLIPLLYTQLQGWGASPELLGWAVIAFGVGMILPGPFGACLMERQSRKAVCVKSIIVFGPLATIGFLLAVNPVWLIVLQGIQGVAFGIAQTALGSTLVNDVLHSSHRNRGDLVFAWAGRLGLPLGMFIGCVLSFIFPLRQAYLWALVACMMALLYIIPTNIPIKAPVKVPVVTLDRFFLPKSFPLCLSLFAAAWVMGRVIGGFPEGYAYLFIALGVLVAFLTQLFLRHRIEQRILVCLSYLLIIGSLVILQSSNIYVLFVGYSLIGVGVGAVSSRHLMDWIDTAEHCQRGTAQNTYMITWRLAFSAGFLAGCYNLFPNFVCEGIFCALSLILYACWVSPHHETVK